MILKQKFMWLLAALLMVAALVVIKGIMNAEKVPDQWNCDHGRWVKQGNPTAPRPQTPCD